MIVFVIVSAFVSVFADKVVYVTVEMICMGRVKQIGHHVSGVACFAPVLLVGDFFVAFESSEIEIWGNYSDYKSSDDLEYELKLDSSD